MTIVRSTRRAAIIIAMMGTLFQCSSKSNSKSNPIDEADREFAASTCQGLSTCNPVIRDAFFGSDTGCREAMFELVDRSDDESQATLESVETCNNWLYSIVGTCSFDRSKGNPPAECFGTALAKKGVSVVLANIGEACTPDIEKATKTGNLCKYGTVCQAGADGSGTCVAQGKEGESCSPNDDGPGTCSSDLYCNKTSSKCVKPKVGDSCSILSKGVECGGALVCYSRACFAPLEAGGNCDVGSQCKSRACVQNTCAKQTLVALGGSFCVDRGLICDVSSYCDEDEDKCLPAIARGQRCEPNPGPPFGPPCSGIDRCLGGICQATTLQGIFANAIEDALKDGDGEALQ